MDAAGYITLTRQSGLIHQMDSIANNIANQSTSGFRREGVVFSEYVQRTGDGPSLSMGFGNTRVVDLSQAGIAQTNGPLDFGIQGPGFFLVQTPQGQQLTRAGAFVAGPDGTLMTADGYAVLDGGGSEMFIPPDARNISVAQDGTLSADGQPLSKIGLWEPVDPLALKHQSGTMFSAPALQPAENGVVMQGYLEDSNVDPVREISTMIAVQRAYELGQSFLDREDERTRGVIQTLGR